MHAIFTIVGMFVLVTFGANPLAGCQRSNKQWSSPDHVQVAHKVMRRAIDRIQAKHKIRPSEISEGMHTQVNRIGLGFDHYGRLSKEEIRYIVVDSTEILLDEINSDEELRPYLRNFPFTTRNIEITLYVENKDRSRIFHPDIGVASSWVGIVVYSTYDPEADYCAYLERVEESYEEALAIVRGQGQSDS